MQEHPIPQDITNYRFHIIGSMTLKQFGEVLLGVIIAFLLYSTNLISVVKWPLILLSVGLGAAAAFVPFEERPLDHWIITFFRVLYKPTKFYWRRVPKVPEPFLFKPQEDNKSKEPTLDLTPAKKQRIKEYISAVPEKSMASQDFTSEELMKMQEILDSFTSVEAVSASVKKQPQPTQEKPRIDVRVRKMRKPVEEVIIYEETKNTVRNATIYEDAPQKELRSTNFDTEKIKLSSDQVAQDIAIPEEGLIKATQKTPEEQQSSLEVKSEDLSDRSYMENADRNTVSTIAAQDAQYNSDLPFPIKPTEPNKLVGMVLSKNNEILTNAIVEIQTPQGNIVRAVKTNALGQFFITTPLKVGDYNIVIEKSGFQFQSQHLKINDTIIPPMEIRSDN